MALYEQLNLNNTSKSFILDARKKYDETRERWHSCFKTIDKLEQRISDLIKNCMSNKGDSIPVNTIRVPKGYTGEFSKPSVQYLFLLGNK